MKMKVEETQMINELSKMPWFQRYRYDKRHLILLIDREIDDSTFTLAFGMDDLVCCLLFAFCHGYLFVSGHGYALDGVWALEMRSKFDNVILYNNNLLFYLCNKNIESNQIT